MYHDIHTWKRLADLSKKYKPLESAFMSLGGLPAEANNKLTNIHHLATSTTVKVEDMLPKIASDIEVMSFF